MTGLLSIRRCMGRFPMELVRMIYAYCKEELPTYCLGNFYSPAVVKAIQDQRKKEVENLFTGHE